MNSARLERYLKQATKGLAVKKRAQVAQELRGNLEQHVLDRMVAGVAQDRALEDVLDDFGAPSLVSRGMWGVHMKPIWTRVMVGVGLSSLVLASLVPASAESVRLFGTKGGLGYAWVSVDNFFEILGWKDGKVEAKNETFKIDKGAINLLQYEFDRKGAAVDSVKVHKGERYISSYDFVNMLSRYDKPVYFDKPVNPTFVIDNKEVSIVSKDAPVDIRGSVAMNIVGQMEDFLMPILKHKHYTSEIMPGKGYQHYIKGNAKPNHPYMALWFGWEPNKVQSQSRFYLRVGMLQSDQSGDFQFETAYREVYFADKWATLGNMKRNQVLLVEMTSRLNPSSYKKYEDLIVPSSILKIPVSIGQKVP